MGLCENWNVTGMYDKLRLEGMLLHVLSVKGGVCIQELKGCAECQPEAGFGFMFGYMFSQALQWFLYFGPDSPLVEEASLCKSGTVRKPINCLAPGAFSLAFSPGLSQADLTHSIHYFFASVLEGSSK